MSPIGCAQKTVRAVSILLTTNLNCPLLKDLTLLRRVFWTLSSAGETLSSPFSGPAVSQGLFCNSFVLVSMTARSECLVFVLPTWCFLFASCVNNLQQDDRHLKSLTFIICAGVGSRSLRVSTARASDSAQCSVGRPQVCVCVFVCMDPGSCQIIYISAQVKNNVGNIRRLPEITSKSSTAWLRPHSPLPQTGLGVAKN